MAAGVEDARRVRRGQLAQGVHAVRDVDEVPAQVWGEAGDFAAERVRVRGIGGGGGVG